MKKTFFIVFLLLPWVVNAQTPEERIAKMGLTIADAPAPKANYVNAVRTGNLMYLAGKGPSDPDGKWITGKLGVDLSVDQGYEAAKIIAMTHVAVLKKELGDLSRVKRIVKVNGMINSAPEFTEHSKVMNGYSDMMVAIFGEKGKHARSSVGMCSLPYNIAVEVEIVVEVAD